MKFAAKLIAITALLSSGTAYAAAPVAVVQACCALAACCGLPCC
ncbi:MULTISPECIES: hypothetical protein [Sphingomonadaceae]|nr:MULTISPECIES: hypothetical protein [Sphingomonadaceae]